MDKVIVILLFMFLANLCQGQTPNFFADGSRWVYHTHESSEPGQYFVHSSDEQIIIHGDTLIGALEYFKLYTTRHNIQEVFLDYPVPHTLKIHSYDSIGPAFLRYDTLVKRVYYLPGIDSTERLIYDFNLQVGDTIPMHSSYFTSTVIRSIDTITIFGVQVKRFLFDFPDNSFDYFNFIVEGMGGSNGLTYFQPLYGWVSGEIYSTNINCFQYQDSIYAPYDGECPFIDFISAVEPISENHTLSISPNPTQGLFTVTISEELLNATCAIVDCLGRVTHIFKLTELNTTAQLCSPGLYFWRIEHDGHVIQTGKLICE
ncbi:MAG: T9SS type A sorting domain-containing protein [Saprospiraceae bacterium]|nr:T9SS type A sorting domain-containing protein [Saprospiraceae bacterium]